MKQVLSLVFVMVLLQAHAQDTIPPKKRIFKVSVYTVSGQNITGYLPAITDSALILSNTEHRLLIYPPPHLEITSVSWSQLEMVQVRRKGATGRGIIIGGILGGAAGTLLALLINNSDMYCIPCMTTLSGGIGGGVIGGITGAIFGATAHKKFVIGGSKPAFDKMRLSILEKVNRVPLE